MTNASALDELAAKFDALPADKLRELDDQLTQAHGDKVWYPNPGPQTAAYYSEADELFYGGEAGGGKTDLLCGLAKNEHHNSLLLRRRKDDVEDMAERFLEIIETRDGYNSQLKVWRNLHIGQRVRFTGCQNESDKQYHKGKAKDFYGFDEIADFTESQYEFITTWNRSTHIREDGTPQRCRVVCTGNPPTTPEGLWVIERWGPWLDPSHANPAEDGELRWYTTDANGDEIEVDGRGPHLIDGVEQLARSRTFIRARLEDNPDLVRTDDYKANLDRLPKEIRDAYRDGRFDLSLKSNPFQVIPTEWVQMAQARWTERPLEGIPMCNLASDIAQGGNDNNTIQYRHDMWFSEIEKIPGKETPLGGSDVAGVLLARRQDNCVITIDCGGGYGGVVYTKLKENGIEVYAYKGSEGTNLKTEDGLLGFFNTRTLAYWLLREALNPDRHHGTEVQLPPDRELLQELTRPTYEITTSGLIKMMKKEDLAEELGRSPDKGDVCAMCNFQGPSAISHASIWLNNDRMNTGRRGQRKRQPVRSGYSVRRRRG